MKTIVVAKAGGYARLSVQEQADPVAGPGEVEVEVRAIGVNFADCIVRMGLYASAKKYVGWPITPGFEVAGVRTDTGESVVAVTRFGGYTSRLVVPEHQVFPMPEGWSFEQAAGFPVVNLTAYYALHTLTQPQAGQRVLVHSAAGGVGGALCQLCHQAGQEVIGTVGSPHKVEVARARGAAHVVDRSAQDTWEVVERVAPDGLDAVFDASGYRTMRQGYRHLRPTGRLVVYGFHSMMKTRSGRPSWPSLLYGVARTPRFSALALTGDNRAVLGFNLSYLFEERDVLASGMAALLAAATEGAITPPKTTPYPLDRVADAHRDIEAGMTVGKLVLVP